MLMERHQRDEQVRRAVFAYVKANDMARRDEIVATLEANPDLAPSAAEINAALKDLDAEGVIYQTSSSVIDGDRFIVVDD